jgi:hypothetical protein
MGFLKRLFGGSGPAPADAPTDPTPSTARSAVDEEQARERELLREDARRLSDDLLQRQLRYADRSWTPPPQGGARRAEDEDAKGNAST